MNTEKTFYILLAIVIILAGAVGYFIHPCKCDEQSTTEIKTHAISTAIDTASTATLDTLTDNYLKSHRHQ